MRKDLLIVLIKALRNKNLDHRAFNLSYWAKNKLPEDSSLSCGTSACAIGLASTLPEFKEAGLSLKKYDYSVYMPVLMKQGQTLEDWDAVAELFGISISNSKYLFSNGRYIGYYITPDMVANRIEKFIKK